MARASAGLIAIIVLGCGGGGGADPATNAADAADSVAGADAHSSTEDQGEAPLAVAPDGTRAFFSLDDGATTPERYFDHPWPSDLRRRAGGQMDLRGFPNPKALSLLDGLAEVAGQRGGAAVTPVAWFRFDAPLAPRTASDVIAPDEAAPIVLIELDPPDGAAPRPVPLVAKTLEEDPYAPPHLLAVAPRPGFVLTPDARWAFVIRRDLGDARGERLGVAPALWTLLHGRTPTAPRGEAAAATFAPLLDALDRAGIPRDEVAAATVFTTGDVVADVAARSDALRARHQVAIDGLAIHQSHARYCELRGGVVMPQFQRGVPPYDDDGRFVLGDDGLPVVQRELRIPVVITLPRDPMPSAGHPLVMYFHGSGGISSQVVDRGRSPGPDQPPARGEGPGFVLAAHGFASVGSAHPVNPERVPGASAIAYLNLGNLAAFPFTFEQGVIEQRLLLDALLDLAIPPELVAGCGLPSLPDGADAHRFAPSPIGAMGQSMGGMYTNLIGATDPRLEVLAPTGAGGFWSFFILETSLIPQASRLIGGLLGTLQAGTELTFLHPAMHLVQMAFEPAEPLVYVPRLAQRPLPGHPARAIYEPVAPGDSFFPTSIYDAMALAYGHEQAGDEVWPTMQAALGLDRRDGLADFPLRANMQSTDGRPYTGAVVQFEPDGFSDPHVIFVQLDDVKHQYGCLFETFFADGVGAIVPPAPLGSPCAP